jgi:ribosome maturation factor RimP
MREDHKIAAQNEVQPLQVVGIVANPVIGRIWALADPLCRSEGVELVHVEFQREQGGRILRLYIDKPGGITLDDCTEISRELGDVLDVKLETELSYRLEVSSPGIDRPLGKLNDFERFEGYLVKIRTKEPIDGQKRFTGSLAGVDGAIIHLRINHQSIAIPFDWITKAQVMGSDGI